MVPVSWYLMLSAGLFSIGLFTFIAKRNLVMMFISLELMLNAANISLMALSHYMQDIRGQMLSLFVIAGAAAGVAIGLALLIAAFRNKPTVDAGDFDTLKG